MIRRTVPQKTISRETKLSGVGLHTGKSVNIIFKPAPVNTGLVFVREDIDGDNQINAHVKFISNTDRGTNLDNGSFRIHTSEHVLAAITGLEEIDLQENRIYDLSPLQNLRKLKVLALNHNQITDITPIADSGYLIWLFLAYNFIKDVSPVENMENLQGLYIGDNPIQNPEVLETMEIDELHFFELKDEPILGHGEEELFEMEFLGLQNEL